MSKSIAAIKAEYPLPAYNYRVTILNDGKSETIGFSEVSGLSVAYDPVTYKDGFSFAMGYAIIPGMAKPVSVTLKRGLTRAGGYLQAWLEAASHGKISDGVKRDVLIDLCDESGTPVIRWTVSAAMPVKLDAPSFNASGNEVAIASLELVAPKVKVEFGL
ncbi:MAG: phage tail protein [Rhodocyclaceae bacterium]|nr:phage tail protein [Rhodocyclaceae bacterium]MBX3667530.1 phage tail protein [Rhodocyclaceae bacterium]